MLEQNKERHGRDERDERLGPAHPPPGEPFDQQRADCDNRQGAYAGERPGHALADQSPSRHAPDHEQPGDAEIQKVKYAYAQRQRDRHLSLELMVANSVVVRELVRDGRADFGIAAVDRVAQGVAPLTETPFCDDEVIVGVPADHPWARAEFVEMNEFTTTPMVVRDPSANTRRVVEESLVARGRSLAPPLAEVGSTSAAKATALEEGVPVLLSRMAVGPADQGLLVRRVKGLDLKRQFAIVTGAEETLPAGARALIAALSASVSHP